MQAPGSFTVLNINTQELSTNPSSLDLLLKNILSINADVVCLQEVFDGSFVYSLYESLKDQYAHFHIPVDASGAFITGLFIASKYIIANPQFSPIATRNHPVDDSLFDCILIDGDIPLGHLYTALLPNPITASGLNKIAEKMQADFIATEKEDLPFFLCGNLGPLQEGQNIVDAYFLDISDEEDINHTLLLQFLPFYSMRIDHKHTLESIQVYAENQVVGLLSTLRKDDETDVHLKNRKTKDPNTNATILCKDKSAKKDAKNENKMKGTVGADNDGADATIEFQHKNKRGFDVTVKGKGAVAPNGNVGGGVELEVSKKF